MPCLCLVLTSYLSPVVQLIFRRDVVSIKPSCRAPSDYLTVCLTVLFFQASILSVLSRLKFILSPILLHFPINRCFSTHYILIQLCYQLHWTAHKIVLGQSILFNMKVDLNLSVLVCTAPHARSVVFCVSSAGQDGVLLVRGKGGAAGDDSDGEGGVGGERGGVRQLGEGGLPSDFSDDSLSDDQNVDLSKVRSDTLHSSNKPHNMR